MRFFHILVALFLFQLTLVAADQVQDAPSASSVVLPPEFTPIPEEVESQAQEKGEKHVFGTEVNRLMKLIINSLYKTKEIFMRELISNASDALDKLRFLALTNSTLLNENPDLKISIVIDSAKKTLTITDAGIGMTREELQKHLGTIAKSGTADFINQTDANLIGQFGVGFYSAFLVADRVSVITKHTNDTQQIWESNSESNYVIYPDPRGSTLGRGTQIVLHIKDDSKEFLNEQVISKLVKRYSEFIHFPIYLWSSRTVTEQVPDEAEEQKKEDDLDAAVEDAETPKKTKTVSKTINEWTLLNENKPIWTKAPSTLEDADYNRFYKQFAKEDAEPLAHIHFKGEGDVHFTGLFYLPANPPFRYLDRTTKSNLDSNIKLYVRRVLIQDDLDTFLPKYLAPLKGIVDSDDFPLNVSRETLQQNAILKMIKKKVVGKILEMLKKMSLDTEKYYTFTQKYGSMIKYGVLEDKKNVKKLVELLRFNSSATNNLTSFADYKSRMRKGQKQIYYLTAMTQQEIDNSPYVEKVIGRGYEVLYMTSPLDEFVLQSVPEYGGFTLQSVAKKGLKFGDEESSEEEKKKLEEKFKPLTDWLQTTLSPAIEKAFVSDRLVKSPCAVVIDQFGASGLMEKVLKAQKYDEKDTARDWMMNYPKYLEINPDHPIMASLLQKIDKPDDTLKEVVRALLDASLMRAGYDIKDHASFFTNVENIVRRNLGVGLDEKAQVVVKPAPEIGPEEPEKKDEMPKLFDQESDHDEL